MRTLIGFSLLLAVVASPALGQEAPHFYRATSVKGAIAYQSTTEKTQFFYIPTQSEAILGDRLTVFRASYYGIGDPFYIKNSVTGKIESSVGAVMSAVAVIDISDAVRKRLIAQIKTDFKIENPKLVPLPLTDTKVRSLLLDGALSVAQLGQITSSSPQFGKEISLSAGAKDNLFAQLLATSDRSSMGVVQANPHFAVELTGNAEFVGDPFKIQVSCDLSQVWKQIRTSVSVSASLGWFRLGEATYNDINQALEKSGACSYKEQPGSQIDRNKNMLPLLEMTRRIFEQMNTEARGGQGFFKFEPNPEAPPVSAGGAKSIWPWSVSVNLGYSSAHFKQTLTWSTTVELQSVFTYPVASLTAMAVVCSPSTAAFFQDLGDTTENCITQRKIDRLMERLAQEKTVVNRKLNDLERRLIEGTVTRDVYDVLYKRWTTESQSEGSLFVATAVNPDLKAMVAAGPVDGVYFTARTSVDQDIVWALEQLARIRR